MQKGYSTIKENGFSRQLDNIRTIIDRLLKLADDVETLAGRIDRAEEMYYAGDYHDQSVWKGEKEYSVFANDFEDIADRLESEIMPSEDDVTYGTDPVSKTMVELEKKIFDIVSDLENIYINDISRGGSVSRWQMADVEKANDIALDVIEFLRVFADKIVMSSGKISDIQAKWEKERDITIQSEKSTIYSKQKNEIPATWEFDEQIRRWNELEKGLIELGNYTKDLSDSIYNAEDAYEDMASNGNSIWAGDKFYRIWFSEINYILDALEHMPLSEDFATEGTAPVTPILKQIEKKADKIIGNIFKAYDKQFEKHGVFGQWKDGGSTIDEQNNLANKAAEYLQKFSYIIFVTAQFIRDFIKDFQQEQAELLKEYEQDTTRQYKIAQLVLPGVPNYRYQVGQTVWVVPSRCWGKVIGVTREGGMGRAIYSVNTTRSGIRNFYTGEIRKAQIKD